MNLTDDTRRLLLALTALSAVPALLLLDAAIALARGWQVVSRLDQAIIGAAVLVLLAGGAALCVSKRRKLLRARYRELLLLVVAATASWGIAELILAAFVRPQAPEQLLLHARWPNLKREFRPTPTVMPGITGVSRYSTNSRGIRGRELPADPEVYRILCLGGSTTECLFLDDTETWPQLLMDRLNQDSGTRPVWVGNLGIAGYATVQHLRFVEQSELADRFNAIVILAGVNDLTAFLMRSSGRLHDDPAIHATAGKFAPLWASSRILSALRVAWHRWNRSYEVEDPEGANYHVRRRIRRDAVRTGALPNGLDESLAGYRARIRAIARQCRAKGVRPIFAMHPVLWDESISQESRALLWMGALDNGRYLSVAKLRHAIDRYNAALHEVCEELSIGCIDLTSLHGREDLYYDDCHFNEAGARAVADLVLQWFHDHAVDYDLR